MIEPESIRSQVDPQPTQCRLSTSLPLCIKHCNPLDVDRQFSAILSYKTYRCQLILGYGSPTHSHMPLSETTPDSDLLSCLRRYKAKLICCPAILRDCNNPVLELIHLLVLGREVMAALEDDEE
jgi:hypothetical protein